MSTDEPSEEELRAAYEAEIKKIGVDQVLLEQVVTLINLGMRRTGLQPGTEDERDPVQVRTAVEAVRALLPLVEAAAGPQAGAIREALSQMQIAYVRMGGAVEDGAPGFAGGPGSAAEPGSGADAGGRPGPAPAADAPSPASAPADGAPAGEPGPAQRSGRLWVPGQP